MTSNVSATSTTGLYGISSNIAVPNSAQQLLNLLYSNGNVNFSLATGNTQVQANALVTSTGGSTYSNANVAAFLPGYTGSLANSSTIIAIDANLGTATTNITTLFANAGTQQTQIDSLSANAATQAVAINTLNANVGAFETYANATFSISSYGNSNVATFLNSFGSNAISTTGNITAGYFVGNAAALDRTTGVAAGTYGSDTTIPTIVVDAKGRITQITTNAISGGGSYGNANVAAYLPTYTGNLNSVTLNQASIGNYLQFDVVGPAVTWTPGRVFWDTTANTLAYYNDNSQMTVNIGEETIIRVRNQTGAAMFNGNVVYIDGATGNTPTANLAIATTFRTSDIIGMLTTDIANNDFGYATINGIVNGLNTNAIAAGTPIFVSDTTPGQYTITEPTAPNYSVQVGVVIRSNPTIGSVLVSPQQLSTEAQHIVGLLPISSGGTNSNATPTAGAVAFGNGTAFSFTAVGTTGQVLSSTGTGTPDWITPYGDANVTAYLAGDIVTGNILANTGFISGPNLDIYATTGSTRSSVAWTSDGEPYFSTAGNYSGIVFDTNGASLDTNDGTNTYGWSFNNVDGTFNTGNLTVTDTATTGNLITTNGVFWANGDPYSTGGGTYGNVEVGQYLTSGATGITANLGNVITAGGVFWANGTAYATSGTGTYGNVNVTAFLNGTAPVNYITGAGNNLTVVGGANTPGSGAILQMAATTIGGFAGPVAYFNSTNVAVASGYISTSYGPRIDDVIYDTVKGRVFANAFPLSTGQTTIPNNQTSKLFVNTPTYTSGVLQQPPLANATPGGTGIVNTSSQTIALIASANVGLQSGYGFGSQNRDTIGSTFGLTVTPVTANSMSATDRIRGALGSLDVVMTGQTWGTMSTSGQNQNTVSAINGASNFNGSGNLASIVGGTYGSFITPSAGNNANIQYATGVLSFTNLLSTAGATAKANIVNARIIAGFVSGFSSNLTVQNAIGLHTYSGWAGSGVVGSANNPVLGRFAVLNEDANTTIQTNGNLTVTGNTSLAAYTESQQDYGNTGGTITFSVYSAAGSVKSLTLTTNLTVNTNNIIMPKGGTLTLIITQDGTGGRTLTSNIKFAGGSKTLSTAAGAIDTISIYNDGTNLLAALVKGYA